MFIPVSTDAPLRYWPIATILAIVANVLVFIWQCCQPHDAFILEHGNGLHPVQWISSSFMHANLPHLIGNMIFLWIFGHVVEGRCGPWIFTALVLLISLIQNSVEQTMMLTASGGGSLGASSVIYGLMAIAGLWLAKCNVNCVVVYYYRCSAQFEIPMLMFAAIYLVMDMTVAVISGFAMSTPFLHSMGGMIGLGIGIAFLWLGWVDCEGQDVRTMLNEAFGFQPAKSKQQLTLELQQEKMETAQKAERLERIRRSSEMHLQAGNPSAALNSLEIAARLDGNANWLEPLMRRTLSGFQSSRDWDQLIQWSRIYEKRYGRRFPEINASIQINLANVLVNVKEAPRQALRALKRLDQGSLNSQQLRHVARIANQAQHKIDSGALEFAVDLDPPIDPLP